MTDEAVSEAPSASNGASVAETEAQIKDRASEAVRMAIAAGLLGADSTFDLVRFRIEGFPVWILRGAWEVARATIPATAAHLRHEWEGSGADPDSDPPPDHLGEWAAAQANGERPTIQIEAGSLPRMIAETIAALASNDNNIYQRTGALVSIIREPRRTEGGRLCEQRPALSVMCPSCRVSAGVTCERDERKGRDIVTRPGTPRLAVLAPPVIVERAALAAHWERYDKRAKDYLPADPCTKTIANIASRRDWPRIRPVKGIIETPTMAPGGRIVEAPGYDDETGFVLLPSCSPGPIDHHPPRDAARNALRYLWTEMCCDFPFRGMGEASPADADRALQYARALECPDAFVGVSMLLSIFARLAIDGAVPGGLFEAAGQGSGKSLQMHAISIIATGRPAGVMTFPMRDGKPNEEELEKILGAYALASARIVSFDNIRGILMGAGLEKVLTAVDTILVRVLGVSENREMPWSAVALFSGNNMTMSDDVAQRVLRSRLESTREDPRSREASSFRHPDLLSALRARRNRLVRAVLTILRAFVAERQAGHEVPDSGTLGSFEAWSHLIPPAIQWAGGPNVLLARPESGRGGDEESEAHLAILRGWKDAWNDQRTSFIIGEAFRQEKDILRNQAPSDGLEDLRAAFRTLTNTRDDRIPSAGSLGTNLGKIRDKPRDGQRLACKFDKHAKANLWRVESI